ncbi:uncharacterized protein sertad2a [Trichomycterus rosablanca]|uniref:uncharacterized protein sertad2a n=1 Tax=Trichomycterus rosablanca TaxID=2290929 RepID=UPI002F3606F9
MSCTGLKRRLEPEDGDEPDTRARKKAAAAPGSSSSCRAQRHEVLKLSLQKLGGASSLVHRVLITNTLRLIQRNEPERNPESPGRPGDTSLVLEQGDGTSSEGVEGLNPGPEEASPSLENQSVGDVPDKDSQLHPGWFEPLSDLTRSLCWPGASFPADLSLDDFLYSEIDDFLCELDPHAPIVSAVSDDLMMSLTGQTFRTDPNELERILEVLVGS